MGFLNSLFGGGKQKTETILPKHVTDTAKQATKTAQDYASRPYQAYGGDTVAGLTDDQLAAYGLIRDYASSGGTGDTLEAALSRMVEGGSAPAQSVSTSTILDPIQGATGKFSLQDYQNPYIDQVVAKTMEALDRDRKLRDLEINAQATASGPGGFAGDSHRILQSENFRNSQDIKGQQAASLYANAFNTATGLKTADTNRMLDVDKTNASLAEQMLSRLMSSGTGAASLSGAGIDQIIKLAAGLETAGAGQQNQEQKSFDDLYRRFLEERDWDKGLAEFLAGISSGVPAPQTQISTQKSNPLSSIASLLGSAASVALAPATGGASLAALPTIGGGTGGLY